MNCAKADPAHNHGWAPSALRPSPTPAGGRGDGPAGGGAAERGRRRRAARGAIMPCLLGCGLRPSEAAALAIGRVERRDGRHRRRSTAAAGRTYLRPGVPLAHLQRQALGRGHALRAAGAPERWWAIAGTSRAACLPIRNAGGRGDGQRRLAPEKGRSATFLDTAGR